MSYTGVISGRPPASPVSEDPTEQLAWFEWATLAEAGFYREDGFWLHKTGQDVVAVRMKGAEPDPACWQLLETLIPTIERLRSSAWAICSEDDSYASGGLDEDARQAVTDLLRRMVILAGGGAAALQELHRALAETDEYAASNCGSPRHAYDPECPGEPISDTTWMADAYYLLWRDMLLEILDLIGTGAPAASLVPVLYGVLRLALTTPERSASGLDYVPPPILLEQLEGLGPIQRTGPPARTWATLPQVLPQAA